jgi:hypothetical protein
MSRTIKGELKGTGVTPVTLKSPQTRFFNPKIGLFWTDAAGGIELECGNSCDWRATAGPIIEEFWAPLCAIWRDGDPIFASVRCLSIVARGARHMRPDDSHGQRRVRSHFEKCVLPERGHKGTVQEGSPCASWRRMCARGCGAHRRRNVSMRVR